MEATRILIIGQKDAMSLGAGHRRVVVLTPDENPTVPPSADVAAICESLGYEHRVARSNSILLEAVQSLRPQLLASILWPRRVPTEVLDLCPVAIDSAQEAINFHPSLLPKHRGSLTQFWAIFEADATAGTTCHRAPVRTGAGGGGDETALSLSHKIAITTEKCFRHILDLFLQELQLPEGEAWDVTKFPYRFRKLHADGFIDPTWSLAEVDRFIRAFYFPPYSAARLRLEDGDGDGAIHNDGSIHSVLNLEHFQALCSGRPFFASPPFWQRKPTGEQLGQMKRYVQAMALLKRHEDGHPLRQLWEQKLQEATKFWSEKPLGTDVAAEACCVSAAASGDDASSDLETLTARLARAVARFSVSPAFEPLLQPLVQRCVEQLGPGEDPWEEAKRGRAGLLSQKNAFANPESSPRPTVGVADAESGVNGVRKTPRIAGGWRLLLGQNDELMRPLW
ncbi:unnamed protein product [Cladocopium goreaui]|uniref:Bifunctional polymyxin resistance protein ArnA n=1 Tax=Cladocopium goreaui TaxID=2562237 RepID=A0A9P1DXH8_9DINO|nr:unnamed protein product [Cladocopium goreaui]